MYCPTLYVTQLTVLSPNLRERIHRDPKESTQDPHKDVSVHVLGNLPTLCGGPVLVEISKGL